jgi:hypothetical protein
MLNNFKNKTNIKAFSLVEISVVIIILMVLIAGLTQSSRLVSLSRITIARNLTSSSAMPWINYLVAWHDSTAIDAFNENENNDGNKVSIWRGAEIKYNDRVNFIQNIESKKPTYTKNAIYGLPAIKFDGIDDFMYSENSEQDVLSYRSASIFAVFEPKKVASNSKQTIFHNPSSCGLELDFGHTFSAKGDFGIASSSGSCGNTQSTNSSFDLVIHNEKIVVSVVIYQSPLSVGNTANVKIYRNGNLWSSNSNNGGFTSSTIQSIQGYSNSLNVFNLGARKGNSGATPDSYYEGFLGELIIFNRSLNNDDRNEIERYLGKKWGIKIKYYEL